MSYDTIPDELDNYPGIHAITGDFYDYRLTRCKFLTVDRRRMYEEFFGSPVVENNNPNKDNLQ